MDWYLVHTRRGCEQAAAYHLEHSLQLEVYIAEAKQYKHGALQRVLLFPGYLFVTAPSGGLAGAERIERIDQVSGCGRLVRRRADRCTGQVAPAVLPGVLVEQLRYSLAAVDAAHDAAAPQWEPLSRIRSGAGPVSNWRVPSPGFTQRPPGSHCSCRSPAQPLPRKTVRNMNRRHPLPSGPGGHEGMVEGFTINELELPD